MAARTALLERYSTVDTVFVDFYCAYLQKVCGTDGVTYDNICALRSVASNVRLDYRGECLNEEGIPVEDTCTQVMERQLCKFNSGNCKALVQPADGCCPICGKYFLKSGDRVGI